MCTKSYHRYGILKYEGCEKLFPIEYLKFPSPSSKKNCEFVDVSTGSEQNEKVL